MQVLASSFHSSTPFCFDRTGAAVPSGVVSSVTSSTSKLHFNQCLSSPTIATSQNFDNNSNNVRLTRSRSIKAKNITSITVEESDASQRVVSSALKRFSMKELENIVQSQLETVVSGHRYNTWLREQVDETEVQLEKYQNRIDVLQKHVNDLSVVIHQYTKNSEEQMEPPMKLARDVGLQVRIENHPGRTPVHEVGDVQQMSGNTSSGEESVSSTTTQDWLTPTSNIQNDLHSTVKSLKVCDRGESHQISSRPIEIDLTGLDDEAAEPAINSSLSSTLPTDQTCLVSKRSLILCSQSKESSVLISSTLTETQAMDLTIDRTLPWIMSDNVRLSGPPLSKDESVHPIDNSLMGTSLPRQSVGWSTTSIQTATKSFSSHEIASVLPSASIETHPPVGSLVENVAVLKKNATHDFYSHPERKRRLPCRISSIDSSTIASVEKYHKLIKKHWYNSRTHHPTGIPPVASAMYGQRMHQLPDCRIDFRAPSVVSKVGTSAQRMPVLKRRQQYAFEKRVKSVGIYRTWKLSLPSSAAQKVPSTQHLPLKPLSQQLQESSKESSSGPPPLIDICEQSITKEKCMQDLHNTSPPLLRPVSIQQELYACKSLASLPDGYRSELTLAKSEKRKRNLPDLIAISDERMGFQSHKLRAMKVYDLDNFTMFKPVLELTRSEEGIQIEWTIPTLPPGQLDQIESYLLYSRKENEMCSAMNTPWFKVAVISPLPLPMCFKLTEVTVGYRYHFQIGPVLRWCQNDIPFSNAISINV